METLDYNSAPQPSRPRGLRVWALVLAFAVPTILMTVFITTDQWIPSAINGAWLFFFEFAFALASGIFLVAKSRLRPGLIEPLMVIFILVQFVWLFFLPMLLL